MDMLPTVTISGADRLGPKSTTTDTVYFVLVKTRKSVRSRQGIQNQMDRQAGSQPGDQSIKQTNPKRGR